jgi:signal transduction histidine kinase
LSLELKTWLEERSLALVAQTIQRAPNMLPDAESLHSFVNVLVDCTDKGAGSQLSMIQAWALREIGADTAVAKDWQTLLRTLKDVIGDGLMAAFPVDLAFTYWRNLDHIFTYALTESIRLYSDTNRVTILEHMIDLRRQLDQVNQSKSSFVAVAAHELKTPLTLLEGYAKMMAEEVPADKPQLGLYLEGFHHGTTRLREIIGDMIDAAMIDSHTFSINFQGVFLEKVLHGVGSGLAKYFLERGVQLEIQPFVVQETTYGDPERLFQAFRNIVINALKYTPDGGRVTISLIRTRPAEVTEEIGGYVDIQIADTGIGIDAQDLELIFEKFASTKDVSLHSTGRTKFKGGGPGLGLPIARGIVEAHGGRIWAESPGRDEKNCPGSIFHVELPLRLKLPAG